MSAVFSKFIQVKKIPNKFVIQKNPQNFSNPVIFFDSRNILNQHKFREDSQYIS